MKRYLFLTHRWLGIALGLFMAMWFISGVVMMYVGYPKLTASERLDGLTAIDKSRLKIGLAEAMAASGAGESPKGARLTSVSSVPRYIVTYENNLTVAVDGLTGARVNNVSPEAATAAVSAFDKGAKANYLDMVQEDAWTHSKALDPHRPLHRVMAAGADSSTLYYVSSRTGEVVRDATRTERIWNWAGAWIHWLYPFRGGWVDGQWKNIMVTAALLATLMAAGGLIVGVLRWKFKGAYANESKSPYRAASMRWHHLLGLAFGAAAFTWILSGLLSVNPWRVFDSGAKPLDEQAYYGGEIRPELFSADLHYMLGKLSLGGAAPREIEWRVLDGKGYLIAYYDGRRTMIISGDGEGEPFAKFPYDLLERAGARLVAGASPAQAQILENYDFYYYARARHTMRGHMAMRLPALRLKFDDANATWVHLDPYTGAVINAADAHKRAQRWLFALLHSLDWAPLLDRRPAWDAIMIILSAGGLAISATGVLIGWRRLERKLSLRRES